MREHAEDAVQFRAVDRVHFHVAFRDHRCAGEAVLQESDLTADLAWADLRQQNAVRFDPGAAAAQQEERSARRILVNERVAGRKLHLAGTSFD